MIYFAIDLSPFAPLHWLPSSTARNRSASPAPDISPEGKYVAFSYLGDIWIVESIRGTARQVTRNVAHDMAPVFSPDGRLLAFSSNRHGNYNVFTIPVQGGKAKRLTFDSAADLVTGWSPDGKHVLFASTRDPGFPPQLCSVLRAR